MLGLINHMMTKKLLKVTFLLLITFGFAIQLELRDEEVPEISPNPDSYVAVGLTDQQL
jgi:hypothetical protein